MPRYDYECPRCGTEFEESHPMAECDKRTHCPACKSVAKRVPTAASIVGFDTYVWSNENQGKGRRISQLDYGIGKPYYAKSRQEAIDEGHRRGYKVTKV